MLQIQLTLDTVVVLPVSYENTQAMTDFLIDSVGTGCDNNQQDCLWQIGQFDFQSY